MSQTTAWKPKTIRTLLNRLVKKKVVGYQRKNREYNYYAIVDKAACVKAESHSLLSRVYGGALKPMLAAFLKSEALSPEDIKELKAILEKKEEK